MILILIPFLVCCLFLLPGCTFISWGKKNLYQGIDLPYDYHKIFDFIRSVKAYDQFTSLASFDVLWLSELVRNSYVDLYAQTTGKRDDQKAHMLRLQQDELKHFITFYVLVPHDIVLTQPHSAWHIFLKVDSMTFDPIDVKTVELDAIYKAFFGKIFNRFKTIYQIKFEARDLYDKQILTDSTQALSLHFRNIHKEVLVVWDLKKNALQAESATSQVQQHKKSVNRFKIRTERVRLKKRREAYEKSV